MFDSFIYYITLRLIYMSSTNKIFNGKSQWIMQYAGHDAVTGLEILKLNENDYGSVS